MNKNLSREEITEIFGIDEWISEGHGIKKVKPKIKEAEILEYRVYETTPIYQHILNKLNVSTYQRYRIQDTLNTLALVSIGTRALGLGSLVTMTEIERRKLALIGAGTLGLLILARAGGAPPAPAPVKYKTCKKEKPPKILFKLAPAYIENVKFHWGGLWFEGDIDVKFDNDSEEGQIGTKQVPEDQPCPEEEEAYHWEVIEGSADLLANWLNEFWEDETNTFISRLTQKLKNAVKPNISVDVKGHWQTDKFSWDTFMTMWNIFTSGTIVTRHGFDVTVTYDFNGEKVKTYHVDLRVRLPIKGDVEWFAW